MEKRLIILFLFLLCGCKDRSFACTRFVGDNATEIILKGKNDQLMIAEVKEIYKLAPEIMADERAMAQLEKQLDKSCRRENDLLIRSYGLPVDEGYSLNETMQQLQKEKYFCE